jgi:hypothetical protein
MKITAQMVVPEIVRDDEATVKHCKEDQSPMFHVPQKVMVLSPSGARSMRLWACEKHPLPDTITDQPEEN